MNRIKKSPYMGGDVEITTGPNGEVANKKLIDHSEKLAKKVYQITDGVYHFVGSGLANSTMIEGKDGLIIIDTGDCIEQSQEHYQAFREYSDKPVTAVIYTHSHYAFGTTTYVQKGRGKDVSIWAHEDVHRTATSFITEIAPTFTRRASFQFGMFLPGEGPDSAPNQGLGLHLLDMKKGVTSGYLAPTAIISGEQEETIAGVRFRFASFGSDTDDTILIWVPDKKMAINNHFWPTFANIYPLRGAAYRAPDEWIAGIDFMRNLGVEHLVGVHGPPLSGQEEIHQALTEYRDGIQFIYDQTIRGINLGLSPDELVEFIILPEELAESPYLQQLYGEIPYYIRQIYNGIMGWFGNDAATLHRVSLGVEAEKIISGFGGEEKVLTEIKMALSGREYAWAAQLATYLMHKDPDHQDAGLLKAKALRHIGQATTAANTRNFCLTQARELEGKINTEKAPFKFVTKDKIIQTPPGTFIKTLRVRLNPEKSTHVDQQLSITFIDLDKSYELHIRNGIAEFLEDFSQEPELGIALERDTWAEMIAELFEGERVQFFSLLKEKSKIKGDADRVKAFFDMFD